MENTDMRETTGNIWDYHKRGEAIVITTNGDINRNGECVMGRGVALEMKQRYPEFPEMLARRLREFGNNVFWFSGYKTFTFPVKYHWNEASSLDLIEYSTWNLVKEVDLTTLDSVYLVRPGCSNGRLAWKDVKPVVEYYLDERFTVVQI